MSWYMYENRAITRFCLGIHVDHPSSRHKTEQNMSMRLERCQNQIMVKRQ